MSSVPVEYSTLVEKKCFSCKRSTAPGLSLFPPLGPSACLCRDCGKLQEFSLVTKTDALKTYVLADRDLETANLKYVSKPNKHGKHPMKLFLERQLQALAMSKHGNLDRVAALREEKDLSRQAKKAKVQPAHDTCNLDLTERLRLLDRGSSYGKRRASAPPPPFHAFLADAVPHAALLERCDVISPGEFSPAAAAAAGPAAAFVLYVMQTALRVHDNPALDVAVHVAARLGAAVFVALPLFREHPYANDRHWSRPTQHSAGRAAPSHTLARARTRARRTRSYACTQGCTRARAHITSSMKN